MPYDVFIAITGPDPDEWEIGSYDELAEALEALEQDILEGRAYSRSEWRWRFVVEYVSLLRGVVETRDRIALPIRLELPDGTTAHVEATHAY